MHYFSGGRIILARIKNLTIEIKHSQRQDFSTLLANIPHDKLKNVIRELNDKLNNVMRELINFCFKDGEKHFPAVNNFRAT